MAEIYEGIKFNNIKISKSIPSHKQLCELKKWCAVFHDRNFAPPYPGGSSGNLSIRVEPGKPEFIITGTATSLKEDMPNSDFVIIEKCNAENNRAYSHGVKEPSSETLLHDAIYKARPEINAVFHGHSPEILEMANFLGIPATEHELPYGTTEVADSVIAILKDYNFVIIKNHGFISLGKTQEETGNRVIQIDEKLK